MSGRKLVLAGAAAAAIGLRLFARPRVDAVIASDAIVALDGDRPLRLRAAASLAAAGLAPTLVVVRGEAVAPELVEAAALPFEIISFVPVPSTTRGEARGVAMLVRERRWRRITVVTSTFHVSRSRLIFGRAVACEVRFVGAGFSRARLPRQVLLESAKLLLALTLRRSP